MATTTTTTQSEHTRSRFGIALTAFLAILRRDLVVTGREFIAFLVQVLLQPLFLLFIFGKVLPSIGFARPGFAAILLPGIVAFTIVLTALQCAPLPLVLDLGLARDSDDPFPVTMPV